MNFTLDKHISPNVSQIFLSGYNISCKTITHELDLSSTFFLFSICDVTSGSHPQENLAKFSYK